MSFPHRRNYVFFSGGIDACQHAAFYCVPTTSQRRSIVCIAPIASESRFHHSDALVCVACGSFKWDFSSIWGFITEEHQEPIRESLLIQLNRVHKYLNEKRFKLCARISEQKQRTHAAHTRRTNRQSSCGNRNELACEGIFFYSILFAGRKLGSNVGRMTKTTLMRAHPTPSAFSLMHHSIWIIQIILAHSHRWRIVKYAL